MKKFLKYTSLIAAIATVGVGCSKFDDVNKDPFLVTEKDPIQVEYFINNSIVASQQDPHIAERVFVLYWKTAGRQQLGGGIYNGGFNNDWTTDYYSNSYMGGWLMAINNGIRVAENQIDAGTQKPYTNNLLQVSRIWRAYLMSELTDNFGPIPLPSASFNGQINPSYSDVKTVYYFLLDELKDASTKLEITVPGPDAKFDQAYGFNFANWQKYANSMRLRLAMRLSEVDAAKAKTEFELAAALPLITNSSETFQVAERPGWDALTGVMSREWNYFQMSATINNLFLGLGGIPSSTQVGAALQASIKPANYIGLKLTDHFTTKTNDPSAGYWLDGLPFSIDPRAYKAYIIPGDVANADFNAYPSWDNTATTTQATLMSGTTPDVVVKTIDAKYHWNAPVGGDWGAKGAKNNVRAANGTIPRHGQKFRNSTNKRIFFANWETYFLIAEAAVRGWNVPMTGQQAYEAGIDANFAFWGLTGSAAAYKTSTDYNRVGTSVSWTHVAEPGTSHVMNFIDGYTNTPGVANILYPVNSLYANGAVKNDRLTKIITQKFIAQTPWLPLEAWSDQRRLGLPFFENPARENPLVNLPALTDANYMTSNVKFFPQRLKYPTSLAATNSVGYTEAVGHLGGADEVLTPLWWAKH